MKKSDSDEFILLVVCIIGVGVFAPLILARFIPKLADILVHLHVLTTTGVLLPIWDGAGLDLGRALIAGAVLLVLALTGFHGIRRSFRLRAQKSHS